MDKWRHPESASARRGRAAYASDMTDDPGRAPDPNEARNREPRLDWEVPEIVAVAVLVTVAVLAVGGLATGIARSVTFQSPYTGFFSIWNAVQFGAQWAGPLIALAVLGVLGVCWWQLQAWAEVIEMPDNSDDDLPEALGHMHRARLMISWAVGALGVTAAGSVAGFAAQVGQQGRIGLAWPPDLISGAGMLAVLVVVSTGVLVGRQLNHRYRTPTPE